MVSTVPGLLQALCVFGLTLHDALKLPEADGPRTVDVVELWCGVGSIAAAASAAGYVVQKFDKYRVPGVTDTDGHASEDLLSWFGFMSAVRCVLAIRRGGLLWMAPVCSSFVFMNSSNCQRRRGNWMGNVNYKPVAEGNLHATVAAFLFALARLRGVFPVLENPAGSVIFRFPVLELVLSLWSTAKAICCRCRFSTDRMGRRWRKAYKLVGATWVKHLNAPCRCKNGLHCPLVHRVMRNNSWKTTGNQKHLRASAAYPLRMGKFVIQQWMTHSSGESATAGRQVKHQGTTGAICPLSTVATGSVWKMPICPLSTVATGSVWKMPLLHTASVSRSTRKAPKTRNAQTISSTWKMLSFDTSLTASGASCASDGQGMGWKTPSFEPTSVAPTRDSRIAWKTPEF